MNAAHRAAEELHLECLRLEKHLQFVRFETVTKERGKQFFHQTSDTSESDKALRSENTETALVLCNMATSHKAPVESLLSLSRGREDTRLFVLINEFFWLSDDNNSKKVIQWIAENKSIWAKAILNFDLASPLEPQKEAFEKYVQSLTENHGHIKYLVALHLRGTTTDQEKKIKFEKLILDATLALYKSGCQICYLDYKLDSLSDRYSDDWRELEEEIKYRGATFRAQIILRPGTKDFSVEMGHRILRSCPHKDCQMQLPRGVFGDFPYVGLERIVIRLMKKITFEATWFSGEGYLQLEGFPASVARLLKKCRGHKGLKTLEFDFMNPAYIRREYTEEETTKLFKGLKKEIEHFPNIDKILINGEDVRDTHEEGYELFETLEEIPTAEAVVEQVFKPVKKFDCFIAHEWGADMSTHKYAIQLREQMVKQGLTVWLDENELDDNVAADITYGIDNSAAIVILLTERYFERGRDVNTNASKEFLYATRRKEVSQFVPLVLDPKMRNPKEWFGPVAMQLPAKLYYDFSSPKAQEENFAKVVVKIRKIHEALRNDEKKN